MNTDEGNNIGLSYLKERGFREEIIKKFELGYNPEARDTFAKAAISIAVQYRTFAKNRIGSCERKWLQDNYRGRIIFPIHNQTGKIAALAQGLSGKMIKRQNISIRRRMKFM